LDLDSPNSSEEETSLDPDSIQANLNNPPFPLADPHFFNSRAWRSAEIPSGNGTTHARALARLYGILANGGKLNGFQLLSSELLKQATQVASEGIDLVSGSYNCLGLGFILNRPPGAFGPHTSAFGHEGWGGAIGFADPEAGIGFGYTMNRLHLDSDPDLRAASLIETLYTSL
jgi:CubicO group peptidase (beta-lactamase class C family)